MKLALSIPGLWRALMIAAGALAAAGLAAELADHVWQVHSELVPMFSLSYERNVPTWYASCLLSACALLLALCGSGKGQQGRAHWLVLSGLFVYISIDELVGIHERASDWFDTGGVLYFGWVIPAAAIVAVTGACYLPFLRRLHPATRRRFAIAAGLYVTGALLFELPLGYWTDYAGDDNLVYAVIDWVEECLELVGTSWFCAALVGHLGAGPDGAPARRLDLIFAHRPDEPVVPEMHD